MLRKEAILLAATEHFGRYGFRGASLRDIARDAGVSLTLLNHHFGCKASLLSAAVDAQRQRLDERTAALSAVQHAPAGSWGVRELVQAWLAADLATAATPDGRLFLQLVARIADDSSLEFDPEVQSRLDRATPVFVDALRQCHPQASRRAAETACQWVGAAVNRFVLGVPPLSGDEQADGAMALQAEDEARLVRFLAAGVEAALTVPACPTRRVSDVALQPPQEPALTA
jgi:AcrR family transcriptional regulator